MHSRFRRCWILDRHTKCRLSVFDHRSNMGRFIHILHMGADESQTAFHYCTAIAIVCVQWERVKVGNATATAAILSDEKKKTHTQQQTNNGESAILAWRAQDLRLRAPSTFYVRNANVTPATNSQWPKENNNRHRLLHENCARGRTGRRYSKYFSSPSLSHLH